MLLMSLGLGIVFLSGVKSMSVLPHGGISEVVYSQNLEKLEIPKPRTLPGPTSNNQNKSYLRDVLIVTLTRYAISFVGGLALLFFILGGVRMLTSFGDDGAITAAKKTVIWSVVGFMIAVFSYAIIAIVGNIQLDAPTSANNTSTATSTTTTTTTTNP